MSHWQGVSCVCKFKSKHELEVISVGEVVITFRSSLGTGTGSEITHSQRLER